MAWEAEKRSYDLMIWFNNYMKICFSLFSSTANRHMLRSLSQYGAGAFEYFDSKSKYNWEAKVHLQMLNVFNMWSLSDISISDTEYFQYLKMGITASSFHGLMGLITVGKRRDIW